MTYQQYFKRFGYKTPQLSECQLESLEAVVVIPAYNEISLVESIQSLDYAGLHNHNVEVIIVFNAAEGDISAHETNQKAMNDLKDCLVQKEMIKSKVHLLNETLPKKHAGVGLARKIGMDLAAKRLEEYGHLIAPIICFDADSKCQNNYLFELLNFFKNHPNMASCSIHFEHPLEGGFDRTTYEGIYNYELHLRYYVMGLNYAALPFAFHTIGSSMAVRAIDYMKQGGMNKRKAGEDFYFLQKFISLGKHGNLNSTCVIPSPRSSNRVPFGTGRAILEMQEKKKDLSLSYAFSSIEVLKSTFVEMKAWRDSPPKFHPLLEEFLGKEVLTEYVNTARMKSKDEDHFKKEFFKKFNAFSCLKFMHYLRDVHFPNEPLSVSVPLLLKELGLEKPENIDVLSFCRTIEKEDHQF